MDLHKIYLLGKGKFKQYRIDTGGGRRRWFTCYLREKNLPQLSICPTAKQNLGSPLIVSGTKENHTGSLGHSSPWLLSLIPGSHFLL